MALCRELLAPQGVVYLSYNTWPGRHARNMLREILLYHLRDIRSPRRRLREARRLLNAIGTNDAREMLARTDDVLYHDDLAPVNDPVWFRDFVSARATRTACSTSGDAGPGPRELSDRSGTVQRLPPHARVPPIAAVPRGGCSWIAGRTPR